MGILSDSLGRFEPVDTKFEERLVSFLGTGSLDGCLVSPQRKLMIELNWMRSDPIPGITLSPNQEDDLTK